MTQIHEQPGADAGNARDGHTEEMLPEREVLFPPTTHWSHRRPLGLGPAALLAALAVGALVLAIVTFAVGPWVAGVIFLAVAGVAVRLFLVAVQREPDAQSVRLASDAADRADGMIRLTAVRLRASSRAAVELAAIWRERRRLRAQFKRQLAPLGEAVYRDESTKAAELKAEAERLARAAAEADGRAAATLAALREQVEKERVPTQKTERLPVIEETDSSDRDGRRQPEMRQ